MSQILSKPASVEVKAVRVESVPFPKAKGEDTLPPPAGIDLAGVRTALAQIRTIADGGELVKAQGRKAALYGDLLKHLAYGNLEAIDVKGLARTALEAEKIDIKPTSVR